MARRSIAGRAATCALLVPLLLGCASSIQTPKAPAEGGRWTRLTTSHFVVLTDVSVQEARAAASEYETAFEELRMTAFPNTAPPPPLTVVLFRDEHEQTSLRPYGAPADYFDQGSGDLEREPTFVLHAGNGPAQSRSREALLATLTSLFLRQKLSATPAWFRAGLAQYFSTMRAEGPFLVLGAAPAGYSERRPFAQTIGPLLAFTDLGEGRGDWGTWALVRFFTDGPGAVRVKFESFRERLDSGVSANEAWHATVGTIPRAEIDQAFVDYMASEEGSLTRRPLLQKPSPSILGVEAMTDLDVQLLAARIAETRASGRAPMMARLAEAERAWPSSPELRYRRGCFALTWGDRGIAESEFEAALAEAPDDPRYLFGALEAIASGGAAPPEASRGKFRAWSARLSRTARTADELSMAARIEADAGRDAEALRHADAAVAADPGSYAAFASRAFVHFRAGRSARAVADQEGAVARGHGDVNRQAAAEILRVYREAQAGWPERQ